jgi:hypothetical protein
VNAADIFVSIGVLLGAGGAGVVIAWAICEWALQSSAW